MQSARRRTDPADDDLTGAVGETSDPAREVLHECGLALRERKLAERSAFVLDWPARKRRTGPRSIAALNERRQRRGGCGQQQGCDLTARFQAGHGTASRPCRRVSNHSVTAADSVKAAMPIPSCHHAWACGTSPAST